MLSGKEALINLSKTCKELELEYGNFKINKKDNEALQTLKEIVQKYEKYKKAFEILKNVVIVSNLDGTYLLSVWANKLMPEPVCYLEKEQGELLEELMTNE